MTDGERWLDDLATQLPRHATIIAALARAVTADQRLRWLEVGCSLGAGRGDELSDIDTAIGYAEPMAAGDVERLAVADLLTAATARASATLGHDLATPWAATARGRLDTTLTTRGAD